MANEETSARNGGGNLVGMFYMSPFIGGNMYKILLSELSNGVCGIYKIDFPNGKVYIGKSNNIKRRFYEHNRPDREQIVCDRAIHKYFGKVKEITILEECNQELLNDREKYWITFYESNIKEKGYNLTEGGEHAKTRSLYTEKEVYEIRQRKFNGERKIDVYKEYSDRSFSGFEKVWLGTSQPQIAKDLIEQMPKLSKQEYSSNANKGENNNKAKLTEADVIDIRNKYKLGKKITEIHKFYPFVSRQTIERVCKRLTWKHIE